MSNITITDMVQEDISEVLRLIYETYDAEGEDLRPDGRIRPEFDWSFSPVLPDHLKSKFFVAKSGGKIVGVAGVVPSSMSYDVWELNWGTVLPIHQGKGVGTALSKHRIEWIRERCPRGYVLVNAKRPGMFFHMGFEPFCCTPDSKFCILSLQPSI